MNDLDNHDDTVRSIQNTVEKNIEKKINFLKITIGTLIIVLAPLLSYLGKVSIEHAIENVKQDIWEDLNAVENIKQDIWKDFSAVKQKIADDVNATQLELKQQVIFMRVLSEATALTTKSELFDNDIAVILKDLNAIATIERYKHRHELAMIVEDVVSALIDHGKSQYVGELEKLFPQVVKNSATINLIFLAYHGFELIKEVDTMRIEALQPTAYQHFYQHLATAKKHKLYAYAIPYELLLTYHLNGDKKHPTVNKILKTTTHLNAKGKAAVLWQLFQMTNPHFWEAYPAVDDYRIADVALSFLQQYHSEIRQLSTTENNVKAELLEKFRNAKSLREQHLGKYILNNLYGINDEKVLTDIFNIRR